jgi:hypothetical protein
LAAAEHAGTGVQQQAAHRPKQAELCSYTSSEQVEYFFREPIPSGPADCAGGWLRSSETASEHRGIARGEDDGRNRIHKTSVLAYLNAFDLRQHGLKPFPILTRNLRWQFLHEIHDLGEELIARVAQ